MMKNDAASLQPGFVKPKTADHVAGIHCQHDFVCADQTIFGAGLATSTALMQSIAIGGALLLLVPFLFSIGKRGGFSAVPNKLFILHVGASVCGGFMVMRLPVLTARP